MTFFAIGAQVFEQYSKPEVDALLAALVERLDALEAAQAGAVQGAGITKIQRITAAEYQALPQKDATTYYVGVE